MASDFSPIVLFVYARPDHTRRTLKALAANALAAQSHLIVYSDAPRSESDAAKVRATRGLVNAASGFRSLTVIERETNYGLARNIMDGVTDVCNRYGRAIVLEDDIFTSPNFLSFMNSALDRYAAEPRVWHVSGWNYPIDTEGLGDAFFWRVMNCWGWATWSDRWAFFQKDPQHLIDSWEKEEIKRFNLDGAHDFWSQVTANRMGKLNTWAIFWYATIFERDGLCFNPARSLVLNIGHDGSGENCGGTNRFAVDHFGESFSDLPDCEAESELAVQRVKAFYDGMQPSFSQRVMRRVKIFVSQMVRS